MTTSRKIYIAVLGIGVAALGWDKAMNSESVSNPQQAQAGPVASGQSAPATAPGQLTPDVLRALNTITQHAPRRRFAIDDAQAARNVFMKTDAFEQAVRVSTTAADPADLLANYKERLQLSSVLIGPDRDYVIINGDIVRIGQAIGSFKLIEIAADSVVMEVEGEKFRMLLSDVG